MSDADQIRSLAAEGVKPADIARQLGTSRQAVWNALQRRGELGRPYEGKDGGRLSLRLTEAQCTRLERARRKGETRTDTAIRLMFRGVGK